MKKKRVAIFVSGRGSNAKAIIQYSNDSNYEVVFILSSKKDSPTFQLAKEHGIDAIYLSKSEFENTEMVLDLLKQRNVDWIVLAGFLRLIPETLVNAFPNRILNIHPALLPKYGGKGMYGMHVHEAVYANGERETGITIHKVNAEYDSGDIVFQLSCTIDPVVEQPEDIAAKVLKMEHHHYPRVLEKVIEESISS